jgi:long-chain acyl-CoA synthetase
MKEKLWYKSYAPGVPKTVEFEKILVTEALTRSAKKYPNHIALNYLGRRITYKELDGLVNQFAKALTDLGIKKGDKVAVCLPNLPQTLISNYAILRIGAVATQNNPLYTERELEYQINDSDARIIITLNLLVPRMQKIMGATKLERIIGCHIHSYLPFPKKQLFPYVKKAMFKELETSDTVLSFEDLIKKYDTSPVAEQGKWEELSTLIYTGGTTGVAKGVMLSHKNISSNVQQFAAWFPDLESGKERLVGTFPIFHSAGYTAIQNFIIWKAFEHLVIPRPEPAAIIDLVKKYKPTFIPGAPTIFVGLLSHPEFRKMDLKFITGFFSGAAPLAADTIRDLKELTGATICEVYGSTETTPIATVTPWGGTIKPGTVGIPVPDTDIKIVDADDFTKEMKQGEAGEIAIKGPQVMMGYYKKPEETAKALKDGWYLTGDIGVFDEDGYLSVVDRKKDMIIAAGYNIYPIEVDNVLFSHPKILEACTIGVNDPYRGETVKAYVVLNAGQTLTEQEVITFCKENLAAYKVPRIIEFIDDLPKSAVGKILRRELRDLEEQKAKKA